MNAQIFAYCERGWNSGFWAEPANAITNAAFILAALYGLWRVSRKPLREQTADAYLLIILLIAIGVGSFLFHTYATRWAASADTAPIALFIVVYLMFAQIRFIGIPPGWATLITLGFLGVAFYVFQNAQCGPAMAMRRDGGPGTCLNGSVGYMPALAALILFGLVMAVQRHPATKYVLGAAVVFSLSLTMRTLDPALCTATEIAGYRLGTHWGWHVLNGVTLGLLVVAAVEHWSHTGRKRAEAGKLG